MSCFASVPGSGVGIEESLTFYVNFDTSDRNSSLGVDVYVVGGHFVIGYRDRTAYVRACIVDPYSAPACTHAPLSIQMGLGLCRAGHLKSWHCGVA